MSIGTPQQGFGNTFVVSTLLGDLIVSSKQSTTCAGNQTYDISASKTAVVVSENVNITVPSHKETMVFNSTTVKDQVCIDNSCTDDVQFFAITDASGDYCSPNILGLAPNDQLGTNLFKVM